MIKYSREKVERERETMETPRCLDEDVAYKRVLVWVLLQ